MSRNLILGICLCLGFYNLSAQDLKGEWVLIQIANSFGQSNNITRVTNDTIYDYAFNRLREKVIFRFAKPHTIIAEDSIRIDFEFSGNNKMRVKAVNNKPENEMKYVRLLPTKDPNNQVSNYKAAKLSMKLQYETLSFELDKKLNDYKALISDAALIAADSVCIEKRKDTYFLNFYTVNMLTSMFPIKEIDKNGLTLYGVPSHEGLVQVEKIE